MRPFGSAFRRTACLAAGIVLAALAGATPPTRAEIVVYGEPDDLLLFPAVPNVPGLGVGSGLEPGPNIFIMSQTRPLVAVAPIRSGGGGRGISDFVFFISPATPMVAQQGFNQPGINRNQIILNRSLGRAHAFSEDAYKSQ